jgi:hypothetical protein
MAGNEIAHGRYEIAPMAGNEIAHDRYQITPVAAMKYPMEAMK